MQKKTLVALLLSASLMVQFLPVIVAAQETLPSGCVMRKNPGIEDCGFTAPGDICDYEDDRPCALCCLLSTVYWVTDWIFTFLIVLVVIFVLWGAFDILTAAGAEAKVNSGRNKIMYAAIGLACAIAAKAVPGIVRYLVSPGAPGV